ncbi:L-histidine N(alpha)-methyltransferase [Aliifodinibius salicampi]|uniref:L-histidine N(Alpha)-methyltransferase n=1 Tax=Fodinibius salicampi TaxID=1920655 RepID=A0ABT3PZ18_9BACT|nr:L-histidine N(alpha)-methyltransferase [Fodinibius salicampi]MCW9713104.1 L-histidine N(alpha)-methyltransferase [Fodinibius salicampi]
MANSKAVNESAMLDEILHGLKRPNKRLPSKYFYDEMGSRLFDQITRLEEYYLTRKEKEILQNNIDEIVDNIGTRAMLVELGSGSSQKTRLLLDQLDNLSAYVPVDISEKYLLKAVNELRLDYPRVTIIPVFADYTNTFRLPDLSGSYENQVIFFPGSTIGNFSPDETQQFLQTMASLSDREAGMLIGVDLKKDREILEAAYNDSKGITASFNKNLLVRVNKEFGADFNTDQFTHKATYNAGKGRIEMHLISDCEQSVLIKDEEVSFEEGEYIHTENSYKYTLEDFESIVSKWFTVKEVWTDEDAFFSVQYLDKK